MPPTLSDPLNLKHDTIVAINGLRLVRGAFVPGAPAGSSCEEALFGIVKSKTNEVSNLQDFPEKPQRVVVGRNINEQNRLLGSEFEDLCSIYCSSICKVLIPIYHFKK